MAASITQANRTISIETPLGQDVLILRAFTGTEAVSQLFHFQLDLVSDDAEIDYDAIIGRNVTIAVRLEDESSWRYFNGHVSRFTQLPSEGRLARYQAAVEPWLWFLTRTSDCKIFQRKSVPDIVQEVFRTFGFQNFELQLNRSYTPWEYCVQYRETAFNFISRLLEQEGIFFFFRHEQGRHTLILADSPSAHKPCPDQPEARYHLVGGGGYAPGDDTVSSWRMEQEIRPGKYALSDFNFETPRDSLLSTLASRIDQGGNSRFEIYDYPGEFANRREGDETVKLRMEEEEACHTTITGESSCRGFCSGFRFNLTGHPRSDQNGSYVLTSVTHSANTGSLLSESDGEGARYSNNFTAMPANTPLRPARITPKPMVQGPQTAIVVGPAGEEIFTDKYGRVKVQFHWDRYGKRDENSSCWVRVSHPWAGKGWGAISIPRIGQEVVVDFLEGDPDQPLITGRVYNAEQMPPYGLPSGAVVSGVKTNSTKGGGGYNEMSMDDTKGKEKITIHAQYDMGTTVEHDDTQTVHNNRTIVVDGTHTETIKKDTTIKITEGNLVHDVEKGTATYHVKGAVTENFDATQTTTVKKAVEIWSTDATILVDAKTSIELHTGSSRMVMKSDGSIRIDGKNIEIIGTQEVKLGVGTQTVTLNNQEVASAGAGIKAAAIGVHEISGALVKIN
ncbi:MAG: type VI secretion system tip protein VgrG [Bryobacteraceae bacterium]|nr:type VI secretion system tip protein VgrG [Bryobacterales bacterium]MEB2363174.1 type VI secretion system tip protein TssI/VgrG [Bryobacterales bacterium]NUN00108.1 type VI secretion system tip protein VgrG [Bryobacteraceae bacterium]